MYYFLLWKKQIVYYKFHFLYKEIRDKFFKFIYNMKKIALLPQVLFLAIVLKLWLKYSILENSIKKTYTRMENIMSEKTATKEQPETSPEVQSVEHAKDMQKSIRKTRSDIMGMFSQYQDVTLESVVTLFRQAGFDDEQTAAAIAQLTLVLDENRNKYITHVNRTLEKNFL